VQYLITDRRSKMDKVDVHTEIAWVWDCPECKQFNEEENEPEDVVMCCACDKKFSAVVHDNI